MFSMPFVDKTSSNKKLLSVVLLFGSWTFTWFVSQLSFSLVVGFYWALHNLIFFYHSTFLWFGLYMFIVFYSNSVILNFGISQSTGLSNLYICRLKLNAFVHNFRSLCEMLIVWMIGKTKLFAAVFLTLELYLALNEHSVNICWMK